MSVESRNPEIIFRTIAEYSISPAYYSMCPICKTQNIGSKTNTNICFFPPPQKHGNGFSRYIYIHVYTSCRVYLLPKTTNPMSPLPFSWVMIFEISTKTKKTLKRKKKTILLPESNSLPLKIGHPHFRKFHRLQSQADFKGFQGVSLAIWLQHPFTSRQFKIWGFLTPRLAQQYLRQADWWNV